MLLQKEITTNDFLGNFKVHKNQLLTGRVQSLLILVGDGVKLEVVARNPRNTAKNIAEATRKLPRPIVVK